ncbi:MAG TPA: PHB depolymerase family esterase [Candidatus Sulfotelmatobacter sp.]|nr:PHB depolymerase family esterase [Candidatus Sulfotelmatobacter sp.]
MQSRPLAAGFHTVDLQIEGRHRPYRLVIPAAPSPAGHRPLVLQLHGRGGGGPWFDRIVGFVALAEPMGFALAVPDAIDGVWNDGRSSVGRRFDLADDVGYLTALVDDVMARTSIDPRRVYVFGMSNGAAMAGRLACQRADRFAAVAQVAGTAAHVVAVDCRPSRPVPILQIHGAADRLAPYEGGRRRGLLARALLLGRGVAGPSIGVDAWARFSVAANGTSAEPIVTRIPPDTTVRTWHGPTPMSDVVFYRLDGMGHTWPGSQPELPRFLFGRTSQTFDAARVIWDFFAAHAR